MNLAPQDSPRPPDDGRPRRSAVEELVVGDVFIVKPGEAIATDGVVVEGTSDVNQAPITGESQPVTKSRAIRSSPPASTARPPSRSGPRRRSPTTPSPGSSRWWRRPRRRRGPASGSSSDSGPGTARSWSWRPCHRRASPLLAASRLENLDHPGDGPDGGRLAVRGHDLDPGHAGRRAGHRGGKGVLIKGGVLPRADGRHQGGGLRQDGDVDLRRARGDRRGPESRAARRSPADRRGADCRRRRPSSSTASTRWAGRSSATPASLGLASANRRFQAVVGSGASAQLGRQVVYVGQAGLLLDPSSATASPASTPTWRAACSRARPW